MQDTINAIPGGVAIYKVTDIFETVYFSDGGTGAVWLHGGGVSEANQT